ncbi:MAG: hypothetical protein JWM40_373 [Frankiales bacterium]|nr:hypothetical protein [Frankiales bacterium]
MANNDGRTRARLAVAAELAHREWSPGRLAAESGADPGTIGDFLSGKRWIKLPTQGKIERALGWPAGTTSAIEAGAEPPAIGDSSVTTDGNDEPEFEFLTRVREDLTADEMDQLLKEATPYLEMLVRDIKNRNRERH